EGAGNVTTASAEARSPTIPVLFVCAIVHGSRPRDAVDLRWIADVLLLTKRMPDWDRVVFLADELGLGRIIASAVEMLSREFEAPIPGPIQERLHQARSDASAVTIHQLMESEDSWPRMRAHLAMLSMVSHRGNRGGLAMLLSFLRFWCQVRTSRAIPGG